ncbi:MAG: cytochrome c [Cryomorphaceae bacterium]|jgi:mono/diheme cytochrome c family protein|nr:cytochrome c [Cryomorphaceae bacterium]
MKKSFLRIVGMLSVSVFVLSACTSNADSPGLEYMPDMYRSPAVEAYVDYGEVRGRIDESKKTRLTAMTPPAFAIPYLGTDSTEVRLMMPYARLANESFKASHGMYSDVLTKEDHYTAAAADGNMIPLNALNAEAVLSKGKELFTAMCQHCHGEKGDGNGPMVTSGAYNGVPNYADRASLSDGQMFYSIYYGKGMMGAHRSLLNKKEIWTVIHYIRSLQSPDYGKFDANGTAAVADTTKQK